MVLVKQALLTLAFPVLVVAGCRGVAGLRDLSYAPPTDAACVAPVLEGSGNGMVRLADLSTKAGYADFCIRTSGGSWSGSVFASGGPSCQPGLAYPQVTVPFAAPVGHIDVKTIPAGASCDADATSEIDGVPVGDARISEAGQGAPVVTLVRYGDSAEHLAALPEEPSSTAATGTYEVRMVNALSSGGPINVGFAGGASLPQTVTPALRNPIQPGHAGSGNEGANWDFDPEGYTTLPDAGGLYIAAVLQGQTNAQFVATTPEYADRQTLFAIGAVGDAAYPVRGLACQDIPPAASPSLLASCGLTALPNLSVDTVNASLYGADAPFENARRPYIEQAIAARSTDLVCLLEADRDTDKASLAAAAMVQFPYSYYVNTTLATQPTDPATADGGVPRAPTMAPCAGADPATVATAYQCVEQNCSGPGGASGHISTAGCLSEECLLQLLPLQSKAASCFDCMLYYLVSELPISAGQTACTQQTQPEQVPLAFDGMAASMILSHYPLKNMQSFILPSTGFRRMVLYAQVDIGPETIDFYCGQLSSPLIIADVPYTGSYGQGTSTNGWENEQQLQVQEVISFVEKTSGASGNRAIIAGDWHASTQDLAADGGVIVGATSPEIMASLGAAFQAQEPPGYVEGCNFCPAPQNPYNGQIEPGDFTHTFLRGFPASAVTDDEYWDTSSTAVAPITGILGEPAPPGGAGPVWEYYPRQVYVLLPGKP
jgi:hypothetical protein